MKANGTGAPDRWAGIERPYTEGDVERLRGRFRIEHTVARLGAERLWRLLHDEPYVAALGALTGAQAVQMVKAGLKAIYVSGWQVAGDANLAGQTYPDQSLYPANSAPALVKRINNALLRADQIDSAEGANGTYWLAPIVADAEAGLRRPAQRVRAHEGVHRGGRRRRPLRGPALARRRSAGTWAARCSCRPSQFVRTLVSARLAADVWTSRPSSSRAPTRSPRRCSRATSTSATASSCTGERTPGGLLPHHARASRRRSRARSRTRRTPTCSGARRRRPTSTRRPQFAEAVHAQLPGQAPRLQLLAVVQLEEAPRRRDDRVVPARARRDGLHVPVRDARRLPRRLQRRCSTSRAATRPKG